MDRDTAAAGRRNIRLLLEYDGTPFCGWQMQPLGPSVQSTLEDAIRKVTGEEVRIKGSGRTDAGVHAVGQVANFHTAARMEADAFRRALNSVLPPGVAVLAADEVPSAFDAQFSALAKTYRYRLLSRRDPSPLEARRAWHVPVPLDLGRMRAAAESLRGRLDFSSFRAAGCVAADPVRTLRRCEISRAGDVVAFELEADGFLRHMVRNIVGTLVEVGRGRFSPNDIAGIIAARDRTRAGMAAPAWGLYLLRVEYPPPDPPG